MADDAYLPFDGESDLNIVFPTNLLPQSNTTLTSFTRDWNEEYQSLRARISNGDFENLQAFRLVIDEFFATAARVGSVYLDFR